MPFTFSHPAIILPLVNKRGTLSATGLIIGSIAPDFESFIKITGPKVYSHTWLGVFWFDLPLTIILCYLFHMVVKEPLMQNLPQVLRTRLEPFKGLNWPAWFKKNWPAALASMVIGIVSHLLFDAFTHLNLYEPDSITSKILVGHTRLYIILQYTSSLIGLAVIGVGVFRLPRVALAVEKHNIFRFWLFLTLIGILIGSILTTEIFEHDPFDAIILINIVITSLLCALVIVTTIYKILSVSNGVKYNSLP